MTTRLSPLRAIAALLLATAVLADTAQARQDFWPLPDVRVQGLGGSSTRFIYVAEGNRWEDVVLTAYAATDGRTHLAVRLDDRTVFQNDIAHPQFINVPIGSLEPGFHRIEFRASLAPEEASRSEAINYCIDEQRIPLILQRMAVTYRQVVAEDRPLSALPDLLFNPAKPRLRPWNASFDVNPDDNDAVSAAARLMTGFHAAASMVPIHAWSADGANADFVVEIVRNDLLDVPAHIAFVPATGVTADGDGDQADTNHPPVEAWDSPPRLRIVFSTPEGLEAATNALLDELFRGQLATPAVDILAQVRPPRWGEVAEFRTLADLGIADLKLDGSGSQSLVLVYPPAWEPVGPPSGQIVVRAQDGLMQGSSMQVWIEDGLAGSTRLDRLASGDIQRAIPFQASRVPVDAVVGLRLEAALIATDDCRPGVLGTAWVDADQSVVTLPYRLKDGLGSLSPALVAKPIIVAGQASPGVVTAAIALSTPLSQITGGAPVPIEVVGPDDENAGDATVRIDVDRDAFRSALLDHADDLFLPESADGVLLLQNDEGYQVLAANDDGLFALARHWQAVEPDLVSGSVTALITTTGELVQLEIRPVEKALPMFERNDPIPWIIAAAVAAFALVIGIYIALRLWRRKA